MSETVLGVSKTRAMKGLFENLKMFYPPEGVCESSSKGVHLTSLSILLGEITVMGVSKTLAMTSLFENLKMIYPPEVVFESSTPEVHLTVFPFYY